MVFKSIMNIYSFFGPPTYYSSTKYVEQGFLFENIKKYTLFIQSHNGNMRLPVKSVIKKIKCVEINKYKLMLNIYYQLQITKGLKYVYKVIMRESSS